MGKTTDISENAERGGRGRSCRMAYSLNNFQPVICTIISDQPLFYHDHEAVMDDDDILMDEELIALDRDIQALKKKVEAYDRLSLEFSQPSDTRVREFMEASALIGFNQPGAAQDIKEFLADLGKSRMAQALIDLAQAHGVRIEYSAQVRDAFYDRAGSAILINPALEIADKYLLATRELRRHAQHRNGALIDPLHFHPDQAVFVHRAQQADLAVFMVRVAWELQLSGERAAWERVENSSLSDLGTTFAREAYVDFRTLNSGQASSAVFETWFLSDRCRIADKDIIQKMLADYRGLVFDTEQIAQSVTMDLIFALGNVPFGKNYLSRYAQMIMTDPIFTDVRDRSNANFLWFIKFEKSFRETEHELQGAGSNLVPGIRSGNSIKEKKDTHAPATIHSLPIHREKRAKQIRRLEHDIRETNVVYVQF